MQFLPEAPIWVVAWEISCFTYVEQQATVALICTQQLYTYCSRDSPGA